MVYFKFEFGFGRSKKGDKKVASKQEKSGMDFAKEEVERLKAEGRYKTASNYMTAVRSWTRFVGNDNWHISEMSGKQVEAYQRWLAEQGICMNTISAYMRALRVLYHRAMKGMGVCMKSIRKEEEDCEPFDKVFTGRAKTAKRSISQTEIQQLKALSLVPGSSLARARDIFLFSFYAMGMPFVDIAYLRKSSIKDGFIHYARHKTGQPIRVAILAPMHVILERYSTSYSDFVFPILSEQEQSPESLHRLYRKKLRQYNYSLHRLSTMINSSRPLSSYVVRHSWASIAYRNHVDVSLIGKALGHTKTSTTLLYIKSLFDPDLAAANQKLMQDLRLE